MEWLSKVSCCAVLVLGTWCVFFMCKCSSAQLVMNFSCMANMLMSLDEVAWYCALMIQCLHGDCSFVRLVYW